MRGIAALSVAIGHIGMIKNGVFGVDLFFCISGFIMMHVTEKSRHKFLEKRAIRILPLYWITTVAIIAMLFIKPDIFRSLTLSSEHFIKSMFFIPYYHTVQNGGHINALNFVGWTLILEVFFYLLFFVAMLISHKHRHYIVTGIMLTMTIIGLTVESDSVFVRFYCKSIMLEFSLGMLAYKLLNSQNFNKWDTSSAFAAIFAAVLIWAGLFLATCNPQVIGLLKTIRVIVFGVPTFAFFLLVFKALEGRSIYRPLIILGDISYSLYLTHWFVIHGFSRLIYDIHSYSPTSMFLATFVVIPLTIIAAWISWWLIENKLTEWLKRQLIRS